MIELELRRRWPSAKATEGELWLDGVLESFTLEDPDRGLDAAMPLAELVERKAFGETAIPTGRYPVILYASPKHGPDTLMLVGVPAFDYVQIHIANRAEELLGCIAVGRERTKRDDDWIGQSGVALAALKAKIVPRIRALEPCWIRVTRATDPVVA